MTDTKFRVLATAALVGLFALCVAAGWLIAWLSGSPETWLIYALVFILCGCMGLIAGMFL